jgi:hypothetical protein
MSVERVVMNAIGTSMGRPGSKYVSGRVDKACLEVAEDEMPKGAAHVPVDIGLVAELVEPYAVLLQ